MDLKSALGLAAVLLTLLRKLLLSFNSWWYEPKLTPGEAPLPPGSLGWPIFGNMAAFLRAFKSDNPDAFVKELQTRYGRLSFYKAFLFWQPTLIAATPEACKLVLSKDSAFDTGWPASTRKLIGKKSFAVVTGTEHLRLRRLIEPTLQSPRALQQYMASIICNVKSSLNRWCEKQQVLLLPELRKLAFRTIHDILFGSESSLNYSEQLPALFSVVNQGVRAIPVNLPGTAFYKALKARKKLESLVQKLVDARKTFKGNHHGTLSLLLSERDDSGEPLDEEQIVDLLIMYMNAGHDSTAHLMLWLIIFIHRHPCVFERLKAEQDEFTMANAEAEVLSPSQIRRMPYLSRVIDETLRLANISPMVFRKAKTDVKFDGFTIPKGWHIACWLRQVHMDPAVHPDPHSFDPERFMKYQASPFSFVPFGLGSRMCPGNELARIEASVLVHCLITGYELKPLNPSGKVVFLPHPRPADMYPVRIIRRS